MRPWGGAVRSRSSAPRSWAACFFGGGPPFLRPSARAASTAGMPSSMALAAASTVFPDRPTWRRRDRERDLREPVRVNFPGLRGRHRCSGRQAASPLPSPPRPALGTWRRRVRTPQRPSPASWRSKSRVGLETILGADVARRARPRWSQKLTSPARASSQYAPRYEQIPSRVGPQEGG